MPESEAESGSESGIKFSDPYPSLSRPAKFLPVLQRILCWSAETVKIGLQLLRKIYSTSPLFNIFHVWVYIRKAQVSAIVYICINFWIFDLRLAIITSYLQKKISLRCACTRGAGLAPPWHSPTPPVGPQQVVTCTSYKDQILSPKNLLSLSPKIFGIGSQNHWAFSACMDEAPHFFCGTAPAPGEKRKQKLFFSVNFFLFRTVVRFLLKCGFILKSVDKVQVKN